MREWIFVSEKARQPDIGWPRHGVRYTVGASRATRARSHSNALTRL